MLPKSINNKKWTPKFIFFNEKKTESFGRFLTNKIDFESQILAPPPLCQFEKENDFISLLLISSQKPFYFCIPLLKTSQPVLPYLPWIQKSIPKTLLPINLSTIALKRKCNFLHTEFQFWNIFVCLIVFWDSWPS